MIYSPHSPTYPLIDCFCMTVRPATEADIPVLVGFQKKMAWETEKIELPEDVLTRGVTELFFYPDRGRYYVAEENQSIVGCLMTTYEWSDWRYGNVLWIQSVYVDEQHRQKGVYSTLYAYIKKMVEDDPALRGIRLYVDKTNTGAQKVYERLGMNGEHYATYEWMKGSY